MLGLNKGGGTSGQQSPMFMGQHQTGASSGLSRGKGGSPQISGLPVEPDRRGQGGTAHLAPGISGLPSFNSGPGGAEPKPAARQPGLSFLPVMPQPQISGLPVQPAPQISGLPVEPNRGGGTAHLPPGLSGLPVEPPGAGGGPRLSGLPVMPQPEFSPIPEFNNPPPFSPIPEYSDHIVRGDWGSNGGIAPNPLSPRPMAQQDPFASIIPQLMALFKQR